MYQGIHIYTVKPPLLTTSTDPLHWSIYFGPKRSLIQVFQLRKPTTSLNRPLKVGPMVGRFREGENICLDCLPLSSAGSSCYISEPFAGHFTPLPEPGTCRCTHSSPDRSGRLWRWTECHVTGSKKHRRWWRGLLSPDWCPVLQPLWKSGTAAS